MSNKICVIGSNSFSGASFCKYLLDKGYEVVGISRSKEPYAALLPYKWSDNLSHFQFHQLDLNNDLDGIEALFDRLKIGVFYNFAAQSMVGQSWLTPEHWFMTNCVSSVKMHNMLRGKDYLQRYVHITTPEVYGSCTGFVNESQAYNPSTPYAVSRAAADMSLKTFFDVHNFPVVFTRAANVFGEGQQLYRIIPKTILSIMTNCKLPLHGGGHSERSFIHIDDVSSATLAIGERGTLGDCYHISTQRIISIRDLIKIICEMLSKDFDEVCEISGDRHGKDAAYLLDSGKLRNSLNWQDKIDLERGLERTIVWAKENFAELQHLPMHYQHKP